MCVGFHLEKLSCLTDFASSGSESGTVCPSQNKPELSQLDFIKKRKWECVEYVESDKYLLSELEQIFEIQQIFFFRGATQLFHLLLRTSALQSHRGNYFEFSIKIQHIDNLQAINHKPNV